MTASTHTNTLGWSREVDDSIASGYGRNYTYTSTTVGTHEWCAVPDEPTGWVLTEADGVTIIGSWAHATLRECKAHAQNNANALIVDARINTLEGALRAADLDTVSGCIAARDACEALAEEHAKAGVYGVARNYRARVDGYQSRAELLHARSINN